MQELGPEDPRRIGEYRLLRRLGSGGMGRVFLGRTAGGRTVAVKMVHSEFASDREFRIRFRQEVAAARQVGGRWTAPVLDADTEGSVPWVATGYVAGPSLHAAVHEYGPLPSATVRALGAGLAEALGAVHRLGLVHRDVKPSNVLLALDGPRLIDFGISRALDAASPLTRTGFLIGSPGYLSPEQAQGQAAGPASDVFSLGAVLAFAATGVAPFGENLAPATLLYRVLHEDPDLRGLDADLHQVVSACLAKNPAARPATDQIRARLDAIGGAGARLGREGWLPPTVSAAVGRLAVELLDLDGDAGQQDPAPPVQNPTRPYPPQQPQYAPQGPQVPQAQPPVPVTMAGHAPATMPAGPGGLGGPGGPGGPAGWRQPGWPATAPTPTGSNRRKPLIAAGAVVVVAAAGAGIWAATASSGNSGHQSGPGVVTTTSSRPAQNDSPTAPISSNPDASGPIPADYLGTWTGQIDGSSLPQPLAYQIAISEGNVGSPVAHIRNDGGTGFICEADAQLVSADSSRLVLKTIPSTVSSGCVPINDPQYYTLNADGTLHLAIASYQGDLSK